MADLTMFGKTYDTVGSSSSNLLLRSKGDIKILWGGKFIDLIKDGKINAECDIKFEIADSADNIKKDGLYLVSKDDSYEAWVSIKGTKLCLTNNESMYVSFINDLEATADLKYKALKNIGFIYDSYQSALNAGLNAGIIYVLETKKLYIIADGVILELTFDNSQTTLGTTLTSNDILNIGTITIDGTTSTISTKDILSLLLNDNSVFKIDSDGIHIESDIIVLGDNVIKSEDSLAGLSGSGFMIYMSGKESIIEVDNIIVRKTIQFPEIQDVTYAEAVNLMSNRGLNIFEKYRIIDFQNEWEVCSETKVLLLDTEQVISITDSEGTVHNNQTVKVLKNVRPIILIPKNSSEFLTLGYFSDNPNWIIDYDISYKVQLKDDLYTKGRITKLTDEYGNTCNFDFKHLKFYFDDDTEYNNGYYLFSRLQTEKEKTDAEQLLNADLTEPNREIYRDASLDGRIKNNIINLENPKMYSQVLLEYIIDEDRTTLVYFLRPEEAPDDCGELEEVTTEERDILLKTMTEEDLEADETLSELLNKLELGLVILNNTINNINGEFLFYFNMLNNTITGTLYKEYQIDDETSYDDCFIYGRLYNNKILGDIIGVQIKYGPYIENSTFKNIIGLTVDNEDLANSSILNTVNFYNDIKNLTLNGNITNTNFYNTIEESTIAAIIDKCNFNDTITELVISSEDEEQFSIFESSFKTIESSTISGDIINCQFNKLITTSEFSNLQNCVFKGIVDTCAINGWRDCSVKALSNFVDDATIEDVKLATFIDDADGEHYINAINGENDNGRITTKLLASESKDVYVIKEKLVVNEHSFMRGMIIMFDGNSDIPDGWAICDGEEHEGVITPNLVGKFIKACGDVDDVGDNEVDDNLDDDNNLTLLSENIPPHTHEATVTIGDASTLVKSEYWDEYQKGEGDKVKIYRTTTTNHNHSASIEFAESSDTVSPVKIEPHAYSLIFIMKL